MNLKSNSQKSGGLTIIRAYGGWCVGSDIIVEIFLVRFFINWKK